MDEQYFIRSRNRVQGPYSAARLQELARRGKFSRYHHISGDRVTWERASAHPELFPDIRPPKLRKVRADEQLNPTSADESNEEADIEADDALDQADTGAEQEWYYSRNGEQVDRSVRLEDLYELARTGHFIGEDYVWTSGMPSWIEASVAFPDLFPVPDNVADAGLQDSTVEIHPSEPLDNAPMAIASFVLGLLGATIIPLIGSILAIVFGHIALKQITKSENRLGGRGMALTGLILGYVVLGIFFIFGVSYICITLLGKTAASG